MPLHHLKIALATLFMTVLPVVAPAQTAPANPANTPSIRLGATVFADYTFTQAPDAVDSEGNRIQANAFNVGRAYINITGNISRVVNFRIAPDIARETGSGSSLLPLTPALPSTTTSRPTTTTSMPASTTAKRTPSLKRTIGKRFNSARRSGRLPRDASRCGASARMPSTTPTATSRTGTERGLSAA